MSIIWALLALTCNKFNKSTKILIKSTLVEKNKISHLSSKDQVCQVDRMNGKEFSLGFRMKDSEDLSFIFIYILYNSF
jgi:hypothetical protein